MLQTRQVTRMKPQSGNAQSGWVFTVSVATAGLLAGCAAPPPRMVYRTVVTAPANTPPPRIYFTPLQGQSDAQQDQDRFECNRWAVNQSGFDPSIPQPSPRYRIATMRDPAPARDTVTGTVAGAAVGAMAASPGHAGTGAAIGAVAGAVVGAISDNQRADAIQDAQDRRAEQLDSLQQRQRATLDNLVDRYRRAMTACLDARGYEVH